MTQMNNELKSAWIRQLKEDWKSANYTYFKNAMRLPMLTLSSAERELGKWCGGSNRRLSISIILIQNHPWEYVQEVLYHEMAHQYVEEGLGIREENPHGEIFKKICMENSLDHTATGEIQSWVEKRKTGPAPCSENHRMLNKVNKLLALAQSTNKHEAQSAMAKAHVLLLKHNLSLLDLQSNLEYIYKQIGNVGRRNPVKSIISAIICKFFFVEAIWTFGYDQHKNQDGRILEIYGTPENVEIAAYVYEYLQHTSEFLWTAYKSDRQIKGDKHRRTFIYGLLDGFYQKLNNQHIENQSNKLVWKGDPLLMAYYRRRNPKRTLSSSKYSRSCKDTYRSGHSQGENLVIHRGIHGRSNREIQFLT